MVKLFFLCSFFSLQLFALSDLHLKIQSYITEEKYSKNLSYIKILFENEKAFYTFGKVDDVKVISKLKESGLLSLFYHEVRELDIAFKSNANPILFVKIISDTLRSMGYYRYITKRSLLDNSEFVYAISFESEYAIDPTLLRKELKKRGCDIEDISKHSMTSWSYKIDLKNAYLDLEKVYANERKKIRGSLYENWFDISEISKLKIEALSGSIWYPYVAFYDKSMHLLKVYKRDKKTYKVTFKLPKDSYYIKISDIYSLKNIKGGLRLESYSKR